MNIKTVLLEAIAQLSSDEATLDVQLLLQHVLNVNRAWLIAHQNDALQPNAHAAYRALINRRINGEPIAYILGYREFYGLKLKVTPDTLIPRPDTETLVEAALANIPLTLQQAQGEWSTELVTQGTTQTVCPELVEGQQKDNSYSPSFPRKRESMLNLNQKMDSRFRGNDEISSISENSQPLRILDLGTGSGAIALAIAKHRPNANVTAVDASQAALDVAIENAQHLEIVNVNFMLSDWFSALNQANNMQKFDVIASNPPYIEANDAHLKQGDLRFEPLTALASGQDGLNDIRNIIHEAKNHLNPHGCLMLEHGYNQAEAVATLLKQASFNKIETLKDLGGNNRVTLGKLSKLSC